MFDGYFYCEFVYVYRKGSQKFLSEAIKSPTFRIASLAMSGVTNNVVYDTLIPSQCESVLGEEFACAIEMRLGIMCMIEATSSAHDSPSTYGASPMMRCTSCMRGSSLVFKYVASSRFTTLPFFNSNLGLKVIFTYILNL
jgi:hypothetical protein